MNAITEHTYCFFSLVFHDEFHVCAGLARWLLVGSHITQPIAFAGGTVRGRKCVESRELFRLKAVLCRNWHSYCLGQETSYCNFLATSINVSQLLTGPWSYHIMRKQVHFSSLNLTLSLILILDPHNYIQRVPELSQRCNIGLMAVSADVTPTWLIWLSFIWRDIDVAHEAKFNDLKMKQNLT